MFRCSKCGALNRVPASRPAGEATCGKCQKPLDVSGAPQAVTASELERAVASSPVPILVDVWAPWCGPCLAVAPAVEELAKERAGELLVLKLNSDENQAHSTRLGIRGIPAFLLYRDGAEVARQAGAMPKSALAGWLSSHGG